MPQHRCHAGAARGLNKPIKSSKRRYPESRPVIVGDNPGVCCGALSRPAKAAWAPVRYDASALAPPSQRFFSVGKFVACLFKFCSPFLNLLGIALLLCCGKVLFALRNLLRCLSKLRFFFLLEGLLSAVGLGSPKRLVQASQLLLAAACRCCRDACFNVCHLGRAPWAEVGRHSLGDVQSQ